MSLTPTPTSEPSSDPLVTAAALARRTTDPHVVYERHGVWTFAAGAAAELRLDRERVTLVHGGTVREEPTGPHPLRQVAALLSGLPWRRAYGWAAFELAHLLHGSAAAAGSGTLLHLLVPEREIVLGPDGAVDASGEGTRAEYAAALADPAPPAAPPHDPAPFREVGADAYKAAVSRAVADINAGLLEKVILSRVVPVPGEIDLPATYVAGRRGNDPARSFLLDLGGVRAAGFSPETVTEVAPDGSVSTQPLAGTRSLVGDPETDLAHRRELLADPKEVFEHAISVRLAQDELRGLCRDGSLHVSEFLDVKERGSVQHLASRVSGVLADGVGPWDALAALFPAVTASGIPKPPALDLIARHESEPRGLYSGAVFAADADGGLDAALVLRSVYSRDGRTWLRAGAGVVAMSTPERELEETNEKLLSVSRFLVPAAAPAAPEVEGPDLSEGALRVLAARLTEEEPEDIELDDNLFELGLDSISLMKVVGTWRQAGVEVSFAELAEHPTLDGWTKLLAARRPAAVPEPGPEPVAAGASADDDGTFPLAVLQHAYWVGRGSGQRLGGVAAHLYTEFDGAEVDPARLRAAIERLVARHAMLRVVVTDNGRQHVAETSGWRGLTVHDLRGLPGAEREAELAAIRDRYSHQMLDIEAGEVFATALTLLPGGRTRLHLDVDMVAADAVSYRILLADLARFYADPDAGLPPLAYDYPSYRAARPAARAESARRAAEWWRDRLPSLPGAPDLPRTPHAPDGPPRVTRRAVTLTAGEKAALETAARAHGVTPAMAVASAFAEVIGAWSAEPRFLLNVPLFDREPVHPDVAGLVGDFTGSVLLEVDLSAPEAFADRARRVQARMHADTAHADYTGVEVLRDLTRLHGEQVLAPVVFTSALGLGELFDAEVRGRFGEPAWIISQGPQVLLDAQITELNGGLLVNWDCREDELADGVADAMFAAFTGLVRRLAADPAAWREAAGGFLPEGQRERRARVNATDRPRSGALLHHGFFARARTAPDAPALLGAETVTYGELADRALRVAGALTARGVRPGDPVAVTLPKGPDQVAAVLGVLAAGAAYVPIGVEQPEARAARIAARTGHRVVLAETGGPETLRPAEALTAAPLAGPLAVPEETTAYILFTSGSTGEPKGVEVPHRAAMATIEDLIDRYGLGPADRTLGLSALDFDLSVFDLFAPLSVGGAVVPVTEDRRDAEGWGALVAEHGVTILNCVPALLDMLLAAGVPLGSTLRAVLLGGDRVGTDLPARLAAAAPRCRFTALGGTTETAIHSTFLEVAGDVPADWHSVPYGVPLGNVRCRVVDAAGTDRPDWVPGELWIGGAGVAHGYRADPARTADRFVEHEGGRWYRTGDLARYRPDGGLEFLGRRDDQVKIRGFRIELGEVEAALAADPEASAAAAAIVGTGSAPVLGAAVVPVPGAPEGVAARIAERARGLLPPHMVPGRITVLDALPLTPNRKIDRRAVAAALAAEAGGPDRGPAPSGALEEVIALVWRQTLGLDGLGAREEYFAVGGDSVLATAIIARLRDLLDTASLSVRALFGAPTVAGLAAALVRGQARPGRLEEIAAVVWEIESMTDAEVLALMDEEGAA
ncbi:mycobactin phenyloxazoline synthetase [Actinocorallia herbida]|uniref:Phenyloxazoline synthase MbtB n=1 Tax=Actinocorallia herbida TaxID=58109 RepID=A0A3N1D108_9ACTN|nr:salicylate synthase [Actinocorallia herbida]ROO87217.1 mycobactin phenyloxazoline synthetase [Actinocorallia herbida]